MTYSYRQRPIGSCQPKRALRGSETGQNVANAIALYERPKLVHSGPTPMRQGEAEEGDPYPWPWVRLDTAAGVPTKFDEATVWLTHLKGTFDVGLRVIGCTFAKGFGEGEPAAAPSFAPVIITAELLQYQAGSTTPVQLASVELKTTIICYPVNSSRPYYPILTILGNGWRAGELGGIYDKDLQNVPLTTRQGQVYPQDRALLQPIRLSIPYGDAGWTPDFETRRDTPCFIKVSCIKDTARDIVWDPAIIDSPASPFRAYRSPEFIRIFNVGSQIHDRGRV
jgi:hypothetical protein